MKEPGDDSPRQLNFKAKIAQFQPHFRHLMQSQVFTFEAELGRGTCLQSSLICHSFSFSRFEELNNFKFFTRAKYYKAKSAQDGQTGTVNSTCQLKSPFDRFSRCQTNLLEYHSQQNEQLGTVMSNDNLLFFWCSKSNKILNRATARTMRATLPPISAYNGLCVLFGERRSLRLISCPDGEPGKSVYNLDGESRRSRLGSCFYDWTYYVTTLIESL